MGDLLSIGQHCSFASCGQNDFLPFKCDCCSQVFCLDHRTYTSHACPAAAGKHTEIIVCPVCAKAVRLTAGQDANAAFDDHSREGCDPANYQRVHNKPRCPVPGCKEKLNSVSTYHCKLCALDVCMKHRDKDDHGCQAAKAASAAAAAAAQRRVLPSLGIRAFMTAQPRAAAAAAAAAKSAQLTAAARQQNAAPDNSVQGTAQRRQQGQVAQQQQQQQRQQQQEPTINPLAAATAASLQSALPEECPQCRTRFATVARLVQHVEDFHPHDGGSSGAAAAGSSGRGPAPAPQQRQQQQQQQQQQQAGQPRGGVNSGRRMNEVFRCPTCRRDFQDAVQLLNHSEHCTAAGGSGGTASPGKCVLC